MHKENETRRNPVAWQWFLFCFALWLAVPGGQAAQESYGELASGSTELIGQMAPSWNLRGWVNSKPLDIGQLQGKVVLLRFFSDHPAGAASIKELDRTYRDKGLLVIGLYAPQPTPTQTSVEQVQRLASALGFTFPVGIDSGWETLNRYWLNRADAEMTATTFLIDRKGMIRYVQPDGQYEKNSSNRAARKEFEKLDKQVQSLLKEEDTTGRTN
ncbi:MAG: redoxin domain-containing protein [Acidobacteria bacterium]|nr:redoxin domain-containing protein [Acidobacteriota bacterium]